TTVEGPADRKRRLREHEGVSGRRSGDAPVFEQAGQDRTEGARADPAAAPQCAAGEGRGRFGQGVLDALAERRGRRREDAIGAEPAVDDVEREGLALRAEFDVRLAAENAIGLSITANNL